jgi:hypothetical protein
MTPEDEIQMYRKHVADLILGTGSMKRENERLREALQKIGYGPPNEVEPLDLLNQFVDLARAALKGDE